VLPVFGEIVSYITMIKKLIIIIYAFLTQKGAGIYAVPARTVTKALIIMISSAMLTILPVKEKRKTNN